MNEISLEPQRVAYGYFFEICEISLEPPWGLSSKMNEIFFDFVHLIIFFEIENFTER